MAPSQSKLQREMGNKDHGVLPRNENEISFKTQQSRLS